MTADSYKKLQVVSSWEALGSLLRELGPHKTTNGLLRVMRGDFSPLWENKANIHGGSYCLKVTRRNAIDVFNRYLAAAALGSCAKDSANQIVGVTISPKKGFHVIKLWNKDAARFSSQSGLAILDKRVSIAEVRYMPHVEKKM